MKTLQDAFEHTLQDIYYAENALTKALPKMAAKAQSPELRQAIEAHLEETKDQVRQLERVFEMLGKKPSSERCHAMDGIIKENEAVTAEAEQPALDAVIIAGSQAVEHYEITRYGTLVSWAQELGMDDAAAILAQVLEQERATDEKLTMLAESSVNARADMGQGSMQMAASGAQGYGQQPR